MIPTRAFFQAADGELHDGVLTPKPPYNCSIVQRSIRERRLTWTANLSAAQWFNEKFGRAELWRATAPADAVLAWFGVDGGFEVVVDPDQLYDLERIE